jgi:hypothetical protein
MDTRGKHYTSKSADFSSSDLTYDKWLDPANPYGKTLNAFLVVEGWNITLLSQLIGITIFLTSCLIAIVTVAYHSLETGLTAGSYAVGLLSVLAGFTFPSAVMEFRVTHRVQRQHLASSQ